MVLYAHKVRVTYYHIVLAFFHSLADEERRRLRLTTSSRIFIHVGCQFNAIVFAIQRQLAYPSVPVVATARATRARAVPTDGYHYFSSSLLSR